jgi:pimeloyl-ACP methyl ester carboxylesterase
MRKLVLAAAFAVVALLAATDGYAERAASIEYDFINRPANLPQGFDAPAGATLRFLAIKAIDGFRVDAALWQPSGKTAAATTLLIGLPGSGGNFAASTNGFLGPGLVAKGYGLLSLNTRQHDERVNTDNFVEIRRDIEAAVYTARALGYRSLVLYGHSLGNIHVQYYAANNWDADIKAVVLSGMFANVPWKSRHILVQNEDTFNALSEAALKSLREGKEREVMFLPMRRTGARGVEEEPVTGQHFLTYRIEASSTADGTYWIKRIPQPILMVRDAGDSIVLPFEPYMLLSAATSAGSLVPSIKYVMLPNPKGMSIAAHGFVDNKVALIETIAAWLADQHL